jgi:hypothetical protein
MTPENDNKNYLCPICGSIREDEHFEDEDEDDDDFDDDFDDEVLGINHVEDKEYKPEDLII